MILLEIFRKLRSAFWLLPGFLLWAAFPPFGEKTDVLFALAPLLYLARQGDVRKSVHRWFAAGLFFWVATLAWMPAIVKNGGPWPLVLLGWAGLAAYCALYFAAFGAIAAVYWRWAFAVRWVGAARLLGLLIVEPLAWCGLELVRSRFLGGFAWNQLGVVAVNGGFGAPAALGGVYLCSAVIVLLNGTIAGIAERLVASARRLPVSRWRSLETLAAFALVWGIYSLAQGSSEWRPAVERRPYREDYLKIALVQRNFPCVFQAQEENPYEAYEKLLANAAELRSELVVLPESAMCEFSQVEGSGARAFADWIMRKTGGAVLAGGTRLEGNPRADGKLFNSAALYERLPAAAAAKPAEDPALRIACYDKVHLVPFGEFIPGDRWIRALKKLAPVGSCTAGEMQLLTLNGADAKAIPFGVAICFEDTDSALLRTFAAKGARFLALITNDSWFSHSDEAVAHSWQAVARAIETGLPLVRVGNSGVTGIILPDGRATWLTDTRGKPLVDAGAVMFDRVRLGDPEAAPTVYVRLGDWPLGIAFLLLILGMILVYYRHCYEKRRYLSM